MAQSYSGSMLQSHNDGANVEPFQVTLESRSSATLPSEKTGKLDAAPAPRLRAGLRRAWATARDARHLRAGSGAQPSLVGPPQDRGTVETVDTVETRKGRFLNGGC